MAWAFRWIEVCAGLNETRTESPPACYRNTAGSCRFGGASLPPGSGVALGGDKWFGAGAGSAATVFSFNALPCSIQGGYWWWCRLGYYPRI